jgi:hypothetical protein
VILSICLNCAGEVLAEGCAPFRWQYHCHLAASRLEWLCVAW